MCVIARALQAARKIVAEPLTVTGSIGVVTGKFNLAELYGKVCCVCVPRSVGTTGCDTASPLSMLNCLHDAATCCYLMFCCCTQIGYAKELISKGRYAELLADQRPFNEV